MVTNPTVIEEKKLCDAQYEKYVVPKLSSDDAGKYVALDIDTGEFELNRDDAQALLILRKRVPDARVWLMKAGHSATYTIR
jgi:hypothetical protein